MFDPLIDGQDRHVARASETPRVEEPLQAAKHARRTIGCGKDAVDEVGTRQMKVIARNRPALMRQQCSIAAKQRLDPAQSFCGRHSTCWCHAPPPTGNAITGNSKSSTSAAAA